MNPIRTWTTRKAMAAITMVILAAGATSSGNALQEGDARAAPAPPARSLSVPATGSLDGAKPTPTIKVCHMCDDEVAATATPTTPAVCFECDAVHPVRLTALVATSTTTPASYAAIVHLAMFWMQGCPACEEVKQNVLPGLKAKYDSHLDVLLIEVVTQEDVDQLFALAADLGIPKEQTGVPFMIISDQVLVGSTRISHELPALIDAYLAKGGVRLPDYPILASELARAIPFELGQEEPAPQGPARPQGFILATVVLVAMAAAFLYATSSIFSSRLPIPHGRSVAQAVPWLAVLGLAVAGYLAYVETQSVAAVCGPVGECNVVQTSAYARLFGVLPVGVLGAFAYLLFLATWAVERRARARVSVWAGLGSFLVALVGTAFSIYLTFLEPFVIRAVCLWCLASSVTMTLLLLFTLHAPRAWRIHQAEARQ